jgi:hypothetical protein
MLMLICLNIYQDWISIIDNRNTNNRWEMKLLWKTFMCLLSLWNALPFRTYRWLSVCNSSKYPLHLALLTWRRLLVTIAMINAISHFIFSLYWIFFTLKRCNRDLSKLSPLQMKSVINSLTDLAESVVLLTIWVGRRQDVLFFSSDCT